MQGASLLAVAGVALVVLSVALLPMPLVVWNASASVPVGLYVRASGTIRRGDIALVRTPDAAVMLAAERGYLPVGVPLVKHVAAVADDDVCVLKLAVSVNGNPVANQLKADHAGRTLPRWNGCRRLNQGEYFLLADTPDSFDSRYFGPVPSVNIIGRLVPLWNE
jgi:conjugative transfer signal peptidase TraF